MAVELHDMKRFELVEKIYQLEDALNKSEKRCENLMEEIVALEREIEMMNSILLVSVKGNPMPALTRAELAMERMQKPEFLLEAEEAALEAISAEVIPEAKEAEGANESATADTFGEAEAPDTSEAFEEMDRLMKELLDETEDADDEAARESADASEDDRRGSHMYYSRKTAKTVARIFAKRRKQ